MKKSLLLIGLFCCLLFVPGWAQDAFPGIGYQGIARDASGRVLANIPLEIEVSFTGTAIDIPAYYTEIHEVITNGEGYFDIVLGQGANKKGDWKTVPWAEQQIWLDVAMINKINPQWKVDSHAQLLSVPYAQHAASAKQFSNKTPSELRNHSIYWTTSGNTKTRPPIHFLGTRDEVDLTVKTDSVTRAIFTKEGQLEIYSGVTGVDSDVNSYAVTVQGSMQGIYIKVIGAGADGGRDSNNNFMTFADDTQVWGRIEGQTLAELTSSAPYIIQAALYAADGARLAVELVGAIGEAAALYAAGTGAAASLIFAFAATGFYASAVAVTAQGIVIGIEAAALLVNSIDWSTSLMNNIGVAYNSGAGDYAEWLEREAGSRDMLPGEIVSITGGVASLFTDKPGQLMVVSTKPAVIGNTPNADEAANYEKIAFLGQVPVKVSGPVQIGDYILPSGNNDGFGKAVAPAEMEIADYEQIVGVAWEAAEDRPMNYVKIGVGLNDNDFAPKVDEIDQKINNIVNYLEGKGPLRPEQNQAFANSKTTKIFSDAEFEQMINGNEATIKELYSGVAQQLRDKGIEVDRVPGLQSFLDNPIEGLKALRKDPAYDTQWAQLDQFIQTQKQKD